MTNLRQDILFACRMLVKRPGIAMVAVLSLALGIGANSAIFSLINSIVLESLPYLEPERLVILSSFPLDKPDQGGGMSVPDFWALKNAPIQTLEVVGTTSGGARDFGSEENGPAAESIPGQLFTPELFQILGVQPIMGRIFTPAEAPLDTPAPVVLLSHQLWERRFDSDPQIINKTIRMDGIPTTIIGVMPPKFSFFNDSAQFWSPLSFSQFQLQGSARGFLVSARLKPGRTIAEAQAEMTALAAQMAEAHPDTNKGWSIRVEPMREFMYGWMSQPLLVLQGAVGFVLLIACANVAGLMMARAASRKVEVAVRTALGAGRSRIVRQLLTESLALSLIGGIFGVFFAWAGLRILVVNSPGWMPRIQEVGINPKVLGFTVLVSLLTGVVFGIAPALRGSKPDLAETLKESGRGTGDVLVRDRLRGALVIAQIALSLVLLIGAGLMINTFLQLRARNLGFDPHGLLSFQFRYPRDQGLQRVGSYNGFPLLELNPAAAILFHRIFERLESVPGVQSVGAMSRPPLTSAGMNLTFTSPGLRAPEAGREDQNSMTASTFIISPNFFATMKVPLLRGRDFTARDTGAGQWVVIINDAMARRFWPNEDPIGKQLRLDLVPEEQPREIIAVVGNLPLTRWDENPSPVMYIPNLQMPVRWRAPYGAERLAMTYVLRTQGDPLSIVGTVRQAVAEIEPDKPLVEIRTVEQYLGEQLSGQRWYMFLLGVFGAVAGLLAIIGIYSVMANSVAQRTREIGIRMALGAGRKQVMTLVMRRAVLLIGIGLVLGIAGSWALTRLISGVLWGVTATDPVTFATVSIGLAFIALLAGFIPARKAISVEPTVALRHE